MADGKILIHFNSQNELFEISNLNNITIEELSMLAQTRFSQTNENYLEHYSNCLCDGPYASKAIDNERFREIVQMVKDRALLDIITGEPNASDPLIELWFCNIFNNGLLNKNIATNDDQSRKGPALAESENHFADDSSLSSNHMKSLLSSQLGAYMGPTSNILTEDKNHESFAEDTLKLTNDFRNEVKKQYKTDIFPLKKHDMAKKSESKKKKPTSQTENNKTKASDKKRKTCMKKKKCVFHLQGVEWKKGSRDGRYPHVQLSQSWYDLMKAKGKVQLWVAVIKRINNRRYIDAQKGFLINKIDPNESLQNPCLVTLEWKSQKDPPQKDYPLKLVLMNITGATGRKCTLEYNEKFDFTHRTVDETSKYLNYSTTNDAIEPEEFHIVIVPTKGEPPLQADWTALVESGSIHYKKATPNKKHKADSSTSSSGDRGLDVTTQQNEEDDDTSEDTEDDADEGDDENYDDDDDDDGEE